MIEPHTHIYTHTHLHTHTFYLPPFSQGACSPSPTPKPSSVGFYGNRLYVGKAGVTPIMLTCSLNSDGSINTCSDTGASASEMNVTRAMVFKDGYVFITNERYPVTRCAVDGGGSLSGCVDTGAVFQGNSYGIDMYQSNDVTLYDPDNPSRAVGSMAFSTVLVRGTITVETLGSGALPALPPTLSVGSPPAAAYNLTTTATYSGTVQVCLVYAASMATPPLPRLLHYTNGAWADITTTSDAGTRTVCGQTTSLSPFALASQIGNYSGGGGGNSGNATSDPHLVGANGAFGGLAGVRVVACGCWGNFKGGISHTLLSLRRLTPSHLHTLNPPRPLDPPPHSPMLHSLFPARRRRQVRL